MTSRAELARRTGLSRSTVSSIVAELSARRRDRRQRRPTTDARPRQGGRPPALISLGRPAGVAVGIDFGKRHLAVALADASHQVLAERREPMPDDYPRGAGLRRCRRARPRAARGRGHRPRPRARRRPRAARVRSTGRTGNGGLDRDPPRLGRGPRGQRDGGAASGCRCRSRTTPTSARSPRSPGARARAASDLIYLKLATGIGAGHHRRRPAVRRPGGTAGEIGHTTLDEHGDICRCGNRGCLETLAGGAGDRRRS